MLWLWSSWLSLPTMHRHDGMPDPMESKEMPVSTRDLIAASRDVVRPPEHQRQEEHPADAGYRPPVSSVKLPSRGLVYPPESPLYRLESLDIKAVTAKEENILSSPVLIRKGTVMSVLMRACITNRMIDPDDMIVGDRNAVLTAIRVSAYGQSYSARVECPHCHEEREHDFDLSRLDLKMLDIEPVGGPGCNEFSFKLPSSGREVRFKMFDANDVSDLERDIEAVKKKTGQEQSVTLRLMAQVTYIQGVEKKDLGRAIEEISARDSRALRSYMDKVSPGVEMRQMYDCEACGKMTEVEVPMGTEFFWPSEV